MNIDRLTVKSHEALLGAKELATKSGHPTLGPLHLLFELVQQEEGVVSFVPERLPAAPVFVPASDQAMVSLERHAVAASLAVLPGKEEDGIYLT